MIAVRSNSSRFLVCLAFSHGWPSSRSVAHNIARSLPVRFLRHPRLARTLKKNLGFSKLIANRQRTAHTMRWEGTVEKLCCN
ncbi:hypothetical protein SynBIOSE41_03772 [Synechococcus sp. BIOS-E4-1]|nr:hypothetical protein SynBIOSE41_03772 [Synechococcus sp. BIOS-E4-1]